MHNAGFAIFLHEIGQQKEVGKMMEGMGRKELKDGIKQEYLSMLIWRERGEGGCWPSHHSQWIWQPSVDLPAQTPQLMNQTWFPPVRETPSLRLCARQNKAHLH